MNIERAIRLLHPDTTADAISEMEYYGGFDGRARVIKEINEACLLACKALTMLTQTRICKVYFKHGERRCVFHGFCDNNNKCVIEYENGELHKVEVWRVKFLNKLSVDQNFSGKQR